MAESKNFNKRRYNTPGVVDGNLAREFDSHELERRLERSGQLDFDQQYKFRKESQAEQIAKQRAKTKAAVRPIQKASPVAVLGFACVAVLLVGLLMCYVQINTISNNIVDMKNQISELEIQQVSLLTQYEQAFDLASVKEAAQAAGMSQPSDSQITYIDLPGQDQAVAYAAKEPGVLSTVIDGISQRFLAVVSYFR